MLALLVRLKRYQRLGYFVKLADVPAVVIDHLRGVLELAEVVVAATGASPTAKRHRQFVCGFLGVEYELAGRARLGRAFQAEHYRRRERDDYPAVTENPFRHQQQWC